MTDSAPDLMFDRHAVTAIREWADEGCPIPADERRRTGLITALNHARQCLLERQREADSLRSLVRQVKHHGYRVLDAEGNDV